VSGLVGPMTGAAGSVFWDIASGGVVLVLVCHLAVGIVGWLQRAMA